MTYIIPRPTDLRTSTQDSYKRSLAIGEAYEDIIVNELAKHGLEAYRPLQRALPGHLLRAHQIDILIKSGPVKRVPMEVKARNSPWSYPNVFVGCVEKWDRKKHVGHLTVIDQVTGDTRVTPVLMHRWQRVRGSNGELSYAVPRYDFSPFDAFIDWFKVEYPYSN
jgi:hypothetical protein